MSVQGVTYSNAPQYRFYLTHHTVTTEVFPLKFLDSSVKWSLESGQVFYRKEFTGSLIFGTNSLVADVGGVMQNRRLDWEYLWDIESLDPCQRLDFLVTKTVSGVTETYIEAYFSTTDGTFDMDNCTFEVTPIIDDPYVEIFDRWEDEYNILDPIFGVTPVVTVVANRGLINQSLDRNRWLWDVVEFLADKVMPGCTVSSTFFNDTPNNPVTLSPSKVNYLTIAQKSDIIRPAGTAATSAMLSFSGLLDILWALFQVKWEYDEDTDTMIIEHISYFQPVGSIDLRTQEPCVATNKYTYAKEKMPKYEKLLMAEADDPNFVGVPIFYNSPCVDPNPKTNTFEVSVDVTTDYEYIYNNPDAIDDEGFVILSNYLDGATYKVNSEVGIYNPTTRLNMHLSTANLQHYYWRDQRVLIEGYLNNVLTTFWSARKVKRQKCNAILCDTLDPMNEVITELGETYFLGERARIEGAVIKPYGETEFDLIYGPEDNTPTALPSTEAALVLTLIEGTGPGHAHYYAYLSETSPIPLVISASPVVYETDEYPLFPDPAAAPQTWTIPDSVTNDDYDFSLDAVIGPNSCYVMNWDLTDASLTGWTIIIQPNPLHVCT